MKTPLLFFHLPHMKSEEQGFIMELLFESRQHTEDTRRPISCKFLELHVLFVPADQWNAKLNKVPAKASESFISAGFIRVFPEITLKTLRSDLDSLLGGEGSLNKYSFLKCVGRSLAIVKSNQEKELKVKLFAPPHASQPELYLLPTVEADSSFCSQTFTPDTSSSSTDEQNPFHPCKAGSPPTATKESVKLPHIPRCSHLPLICSGLEEEESEEEDEDDQSSSTSHRGNVEDALCPARKVEEGGCSENRKNQRELQLVSIKKALERCKVASAGTKQWPDIKDTKKKKTQRKRNGNRKAAKQLEDRDSGFSLPDRIEKSRNTHELMPIKHEVEVEETENILESNSASSVPQSREMLVEGIKLMREERKQLEWTKQELLRKGKDMLAQSSHRRIQSRDSWKKKYFETKKATIPLEDNLRSGRQELDICYNKLLLRLQARESRGKVRRQGRSSLKNELIIQIIKETYEIDCLKRKLEDAKMKLVTEMKLRTQAATELNALKAELLQKKSQLKGNTARGRLQVQSSFI